jgi:hypothetical protein
MKRTRGLAAVAILTVLAGAWAVPVGAASQAPPWEQDSRTVPHGEWVQVSGEIQQTAKVRSDGGQEQLMALLEPVEGGRIMIDLGPVANLESVQLQDKDYIHVRGTPLQQGDTVMIVAGEIIADGKMLPIRRDQGQTPRAASPSEKRADQVPPHPAAPAASSVPGRSESGTAP